MLTGKFNPSARILNLSMATILVSALCWPNAGEAADPTFAVRLINRSITKSQVHVWDENQAHKELLNTRMDGGAELTVKAVAKVVPDLPGKGPGTHVSWEIEALDDQGFPFKPGAKAPVRCGKFMSFKDNERFEVSPYNNVPGTSC